MIQWVDTHCREWARFKRRALYGNEGWPPRSALGRLIDEGHGASHGVMRDRSPEVMTGVGLQVSRALHKMAATSEMEKPWQVIHAHYIFGGRAKVKAEALRVTLQAYWKHLNGAHHYLAGTIEDVPREAESYIRNSACV